MITTPNTIPPFATDGTVPDRIPADETFDGTWPFAPHFYKGNGFEQHYVDEGEGDPIVLLHGEPMWGYLYRNFIPALAKTHRVIVPDHMGFGKSATPQDKEYCLRTHTLDLIGLLDSLQLDKPVTLFVQDWGCLIGLHYALRNPCQGGAHHGHFLRADAANPGTEDRAPGRLPADQRRTDARGSHGGGPPGTQRIADGNPFHAV